MFQEVDRASAGVEKPLDILAIAAHPDDVEQTCGGTPEIRLKEADAAACKLQLAWRGNMRLPDARLENTISVRMSLAAEIRNLRPRVVILPYWEARHPDHYRASDIGFESCFLAGLKKLDEATEPHRPQKVIYSSLYANVTPSFVVDISAQFERRMAALFPQQQEIHDHLAAIARFYGNLIGVKYGEPFVVKETMRVDDIATMGVR